MTDISTHVTSRDLSKKLYLLKVKQESHFYFSAFNHFDDDLSLDQLKDLQDKGQWDLGQDEGKNARKTRYSAFLATELAEMAMTKINSTLFEIIKVHSITCGKTLYCARYYDQRIIAKADENMSNAIANLLIVLIENNLVDKKWKKRWLTE